jgi:hypothetical protein
MAGDDYEIFRDAILSAFKKRKTSFLMTESILKEIRFQKAVFPKEDKERLDAILEKMREQDLVVLNQPKFVALSPLGRNETDKLTDTRVMEIGKEMEERAK